MKKPVAFLPMLIGLLIFGYDACCPEVTPAQLPGPPDIAKRLPNDQIEGTIWEYTGTLKRKTKDGEEVPKLEGKFRMEGTALFDISPRAPLPKRDEVKKVVEGLKEGNPPDLKLPAKPQQKRIGQYRKLSAGKYRLDFDDKDSLHGIMIIWKKGNNADVWMGTYAEKQGTKTTEEWIVNLRPIED